MIDFFSDNIKLEDLGIATKLFEESRTGFLKLFNNSPICMSMTTTNLGKRTYVKVNKKFLEKFGFERSEIVGRTSVDIGILDPEESERVSAIIKEKGRLENDYVKCIAKNGQVVHTLSSIETMELSGEPYLVAFFIDITKIIEQQAIIEKHVQQLETVNRELEAFSYSVSHDLRAPLRAINGFASILEEDFYALLNDEGKHALTAVKCNAQKMDHLIEDLLTFARSGKKEIQKKNIDMNKLVNEVLADLQNAMNHHATIEIGTLHAVNGDEMLIKQVMINLLSNALKYSAKKTNPVVEINSKLKDNTVIYTITDNGTGFDMNYASKLFGVFQRFHTATEFEGTGIGLAIVQRILNKHSGTIQAEAIVGKGAMFTFTLPK